MQSVAQEDRSCETQLSLLGAHVYVADVIDWACRTRESKDFSDSLSSEERARAAGFVFGHHRARYLASHTYLRARLSTHFGEILRGDAFDAGVFGKPRFSSRAASLVQGHFSLSHCEDFAAVACMHSGEVGVDIELQRPIPDATALAATLFTVAENAQLAQVPAGPARDNAFLHGWTRKEACLKALGTGLSLEARAVDAGLTPDTHALSVIWNSQPIALEVASFLCGDCVIGAVARVLTPDFRLNA
jgi:4'-phosphopantetheinyl transferase